MSSIETILRRFEQPDETREFDKGRFELVRIGGMTIGRATYAPGWKWSEHVGPSVGASRCHVEHLGLVLSGVAVAAFDDGRVVELKPGTLFHIPAIARQLGGGRQAVCLAAFHRERSVRAVNCFLCVLRVLCGDRCPVSRTGVPASDLERRVNR